MFSSCYSVTTDMASNSCLIDPDVYGHSVYIAYCTFLNPEFGASIVTLCHENEDTAIC